MKKLLCLDIEVLPNYFLIAAKGLQTGKILRMDMFGEDASLSIEDRRELNRLLTKYTTFGFNSLRYDMPLISLALGGATCESIYQTSKAMIERNLHQNATYKMFNIEQRPYDHFDISEPSPAVMISLKNYGTRVGSQKLQEFYLDPNEPIEPSDVKALKDYCDNDLNVTIDLYKAIEDRINLRVSMSEEYGLDLRSKSDAQIAEAVIASELDAEGIRAVKPSLGDDYIAQYQAPEFIEFERQDLQELVEDIEAVDFELAANGAVKMPKSLSNKKITIGNTVYKMGIGGLHSQEKSLSVVSDENNVMRNADFTSYYPFIILNLGLFPKHLGKGFLRIYRKIVEDRIESKARIPHIKDELKLLYGMIGKKD